MANPQKIPSNEPEVEPSPLEPYKDEELMAEFFVDFKEAHEQCTNVLIQLETDSDNVPLLNQLFRSVHTIKGNLIYVGLKEISPLLQSVEDILDAIRARELAYDSALSDVIILAMDCTKNLVKAKINGKTTRFHSRLFKAACKGISNIATVASNKRNQAIRDAILLLDPSTQIANLSSRRTEQKKTPDNQPSAEEKSTRRLLKKYGVRMDDDMQLFLSLARPTEERSHYWRGRTFRLLEIGLAMNDAANCPVPKEQLAAAILMHDVGMAFLPLDILHKKSPLTAKELKVMSSHPKTGADLIKKMGDWSCAADIVLQHHEHIDGSGYPKGLTSIEICDGAKILSIIDTFDARTHERAHTAKMKRPFIRALLEINKCAGTHFSQKWVEVFNDVIRTLPQYQQN